MNLNGARTMDSVSNIRVLHGEVTRLNMNMTIRLGGVDSRQGEQDRRLAAIETKLDALLATLAGGAPPFRWATLYVTEGRLEHEDLSEAVLMTDAQRVADAVKQAVRLETVAAEAEGEQLAGGAWCAGCRRRARCPVAAAG